MEIAHSDLGAKNGKCDSRLSLCAAHAAKISGIHRRRDSYAGDRNRREYRHFLAARSSPAASPASAEAGTACGAALAWRRAREPLGRRRAGGADIFLSDVQGAAGEK